MIKNYDSVLINKRLPACPLLGLSENTPVKLLSSTVNRKWLDDKKKFSEVVESITYLCVEPKLYRQIKVKIDGLTEPIIDNESLQLLIETEGAPDVILDNLTVMAYIDRKSTPWALRDSFKADSIRFAEEFEI